MAALRVNEIGVEYFSRIFTIFHAMNSGLPIKCMMYTTATKAKLTNAPYHFQINAIHSRTLACIANLVYYKSKLSQAIIIAVVCVWVRLYRIVIH